MMICCKMNVKPLPCPFVHNFCNSFITQSRAPPLVACNTQLYYCSIWKASFVSFLKKFFDTPEGSLFRNLSVTIESNNSCTMPDVCTCPTLCNIGWTNFRALLDYSATFLLLCLLRNRLSIICLRDPRTAFLRSEALLFSIITLPSSPSTSEIPFCYNSVSLVFESETISPFWASCSLCLDLLKHNYVCRDCSVFHRTFFLPILLNRLHVQKLSIYETPHIPAAPIIDNLLRLV